MQTYLNGVRFSDASTAVRFVPQLLTDAQKLQARENIGVAANSPTVLDFGSVAEVEAYDIPADIVSVNVTGYYESGDGGNALYKRVDTEPSHGGKVQSADGTWWEITGNKLDVRAFGAIGDGVADDFLPIKAAFDYVNSIGGGTVRAPSTYSVTQQLRIYGNTTLDLCGTGYIRRDFNTSGTGAGLISAQGTGQRSIKIINGTLDGNGQNFTQAHNIFTAVSAIDPVFENVRFLNVVDFHAIDCGDTSGLRAKNCKFLGFANKSGTRPHSEAIQTDPALASATRVNSDWIIEGCYFGANPENTDPDFGPWATGVGNHAGADNSVSQNINIVNNTFDGMTYAGVRPFAWDDVLIGGNTFKNCARNVYGAVYAGTVTRGNSDITISGNTFNGAVNGIYFEDSGTNTIPTTGLIITGNKFTGGTTAIRLQNVIDFTVNANRFGAFATVLNVNKGEGCFTGNQVSDLTGAAIFVGATAGSIVNVTGNTFRKLVGGRAVHFSSAMLGGKISENIVIDCSGSSALQADGSAANIDINNNTILQGPLGLVPTTAAVNCSSGSVNPKVADNVVGSGVPREIVSAVGFYRGFGSGTPEGAQTAPIGSEWNDITNGVKYMKKSGTGNTGWKLVTQEA